MPGGAGLTPKLLTNNQSLKSKSMVNVKNIEKIYTSLWRSEKEYKFSQLRAVLKEHNVTDLDSLKLNLKSDREALLKIAEKFLMDALNIGNGFVAQSSENDYPDIPLTYAWQFVHASAYEGVDGGKDCCLYPIESKGSVALEQAKSDDAVYLQLVNYMKEAFETDIEQQLNSR